MWTIDGESVGVVSAYTFSDVGANQTIDVTLGEHVAVTSPATMIVSLPLLLDD